MGDVVGRGLGSCEVVVGGQGKGEGKVSGEIEGFGLIVFCVFFWHWFLRL